MKCQHPFKEIDRKGTCECPLCGAELQYDTAGKKEPIILKEGIDFDSINPRELPSERKAAIAWTAKEIGVKKVVSATGLPAALVGGWVGTYTRDWESFKAKYRQTARAKKKEAKPGVAVAFHAIAEIHQIHIVSFNPLHQCFLCGFDIQHIPHYIDTPSGERLWMDDNCAKGLQRLLSSLSIDYQVREA